MANVKISDLTAASAAADANEFEINEGGTSKKVTGAQLKAYANAGDGALATKDTVATADIDNLAVTTGKLAADAVDGTKIADDAIGNEHIATGAVNADSIAANAVGATELNVTGNGTSGQYLASDGDGTMTWTTLAAGGGFSNMQVFNNPGTWTNPGNIEKVKVIVTGGGGGGGSARYTPGQAGGGGAGGTAIEIISFPSTTNVPVTVGTGGNGGNASTNNHGNPGNTSSFGGYCSASGGYGGRNGPSGVPSGLGGVGSGGLLNLRGIGGGEFTNTFDNNTAQPGGSSYWTAGGHGSGPNLGTVYGATGNSQAGSLGSGGGGNHLASAPPGAVGGSGVVVVEY